VIARGIPDQPRLPKRIPPVPSVVPPSRRAWFSTEGWIETPVLDRAALGGTSLAGPLIVQEYDATCLVPPGGRAALDGFGNITIALG
jgi:N-methylhydantoinase A